MDERKIDSKELGLVLAQQLLNVEDLHYGLWHDDLEVSLGNLVTAQQRYTDMLLNELPKQTEGGEKIKVLDIGCGTGHLLGQMLDKGYAADGVIPAPHLANKVREHIAARHNTTARIYECRLEDLPQEACRNQYDVAFFSESYQYIPLRHSFPKLEQILKPGGLVIICDFFKTESEGDGGKGDGSFRGGHRMVDFYETLQSKPFVIEKDENITSLVSPNLKLVNDILMDKIGPAGSTIGAYLKSNYPILSWLGTKLLRKKGQKIKYKYFSGLRSQATFERYKTYHLITLRYSGKGH